VGELRRVGVGEGGPGAGDGGCFRVLTCFACAMKLPRRVKDETPRCEVLTPYVCMEGWRDLR